MGRREYLLYFHRRVDFEPLDTGWYWQASEGEDLVVEPQGPFATMAEAATAMVNHHAPSAVITKNRETEAD